MAQRSKTYRGQKRDQEHLGCGCFLCTGKDRGNQYVTRNNEAKKEMKQIIDNFVLDRVMLFLQISLK